MRLLESVSRRRQCRCKTDHVIGIFASVSRNTAAAARVQVWASYGNMVELYVHAPLRLLSQDYFVSFLSQFFMSICNNCLTQPRSSGSHFLKLPLINFWQSGSTDQCLPGMQNLCIVTGTTNQSTGSI